ncbi:APC family permease [Egicoccus sp. AB-alg6-2]|uniref:APC family permease n=1 Tax=Egicoccus sp. AB-alg6-2 TaxID=3242692 RepID=UPI00359EBD92
MNHSSPSLARRLTTFDAVVIGLGAMIGAGIFAAPGPAAASAGSWLLLGLALAALVAYANATSSAQLAALHPEAGGTYVYARERLGSYWGFLAGWSFVVGKTASLAAMALTFGAYVAPAYARPIGIAAVVVMAGVNYLGVEKTARLSRVIVALVLAALTVAVAAMLGGGGPAAGNLDAALPAGPYGVLQAGGLLFFAFAGYARLATLGEEVEDPAVTIPRAIPLALGIVVAVYAVVLGAALLTAGPQALAEAPAPLVAAVESGRFAAAAPAVRVGAAIAAAGVLLSLLAGVSRTTLSMARRRELPRFLDAVHPRRRTPHHAEFTAAATVCAIVLVADLRGAIGFSSFAVLTYYALTNASAATLTGAERRWPRWLARLGLALCVLLAGSLPPVAVIGGAALLAVGSLVWLVTRAAQRP